LGLFVFIVEVVAKKSAIRISITGNQIAFVFVHRFVRWLVQDVISPHKCSYVILEHILPLLLKVTL